VLTRTKLRLAALVGAVTMAIGLGAAPAASAQQQTGLVNVIVGDVTILEEVGIGVAANVAVNLCPGVQVNAAVLAIARQKNQQTVVCQTGEQNADVTITQ
jgi:hypothetical protein